MASETEIQKLLGDDPANAESLAMLVDRCLTEKGSVVPFVGAGLSRSWGFPLWGEFLVAAAGNRPTLVEQIKTRIKADEYEEAAEDLKDVLGFAIFQNKLAKTFGDSVIAGRTITGSVALLTRFPVTRVITTNFDRVLETAFSQHGIPVRPLYGSKVEYDVEALQQSKPFFLKLHGDWEDCDNRVLTLQEYETAYGNREPDRTDWSCPLPDLLSLLLKTRCFLFVGCSLAQDRTMRVLSQITKRFPNRMYHFAIVERPEGHEENGSALAARKKELESLSIIPIWYPYKQHNLIENILQYLVEKMEEVFPPTRTTLHIPNPGNTIIGRQRDIEKITAKLENERLVTILGPGGCGKSRLSVEVARALVPKFPDGIWFIPLSELSVTPGEENPLPSHVGKLIGVPERPTHPPNEALVNRLSSGTDLLILDNCEHLIDSCREFVVALLNACPRTKILTTSRVVLDGYPFERVYPLDQLSVPAADQVSAVEIGASSAVMLFIERAKQRIPDFELTPENATAIATTCRALCGIPLAIEITAALLVGNTIQSLSREISENTSSLLDESIKGDPRHYTLRAAIGRSYELLKPEAQMFLRQLSVFRGGWTLDACSAVCNTGGSLTNSRELVRLLLDSSLLVTQEVNQNMRFGFLEPIRQFVQQQLTASEADSVQHRHAEWFSAIAEQAAPKLITGEQNATLIALQADLDNFRVAARWTVDKHQLETGLRLMAGLWRFMEVRAYYTEGLARAKEILALSGTEAFPELKCKLLAGAGMLAYRMAKYEDAHSLFLACFEIANTRDDKVGMAEALGDLGLVAMMKGDFPRAQEFQTRCKELEQVNQNARNVAVANYNLGFLAVGMGSYSDAAELLRAALQEFESAGNDRESAFALNSLARCCMVSGDLDTANKYSERALAIRRKLLDSKCVADSLRTSAWAALEAGRDSAAMDQLKEAIGLARGVDDSRGVSEALDLIALTVAMQERPVNLVVLAAAAEHIRGPYGYALPPALIAERTRALARAKELLGEMEYSRAYDRGKALAIPDAIVEAVQAAAGVSAA